MSYDPFDPSKRDRTPKREATKLVIEQQQEDIRWLMSSSQGRRFMHRLLDTCGVYRTSFTGNSETYFREGMRNIGLILLADVHSLSPEDFVKMLKEHGNDRPSDPSSNRDR
jgi:hypothetical protein